MWLVWQFTHCFLCVRVKFFNETNEVIKKPPNFDGSGKSIVEK